MGQARPDSTCAQAHVGTPFPDAAPVRPVGVSPRTDRITVDLSAFSHLPRLLTPKRVQEESSLSKGVINRAIQTGELGSIKPTPRARRIPVEDFAIWIAKMKAQAVSS